MSSRTRHVVDASLITVFSSDVESLKKGIIKKPYIIFLVGESGVGKSSVLEFIPNVLIGNTLLITTASISSTTPLNKVVLDNQSQTNSARYLNLRARMA